MEMCKWTRMWVRYTEEIILNHLVGKGNDLDTFTIITRRLTSQSCGAGKMHQVSLSNSCKLPWKAWISSTSSVITPNDRAPSLFPTRYNEVLCLHPSHHCNSFRLAEEIVAANGYRELCSFDQLFWNPMETLISTGKEPFGEDNWEWLVFRWDELHVLKDQLSI